ncbi:WXG100 family type VII secretion target [Aminipila sp.]|uniref:WXG100 family type VII secretion target n=1 Tax=Aminipila sp. TaxID=2060095 RepID=UPI0028A15674|nr:hypothetical protein [Aminipila sp.]
MATEYDIKVIEKGFADASSGLSVKKQELIEETQQVESVCNNLKTVWNGEGAEAFDFTVKNLIQNLVDQQERIDIQKQCIEETKQAMNTTDDSIGDGYSAVKAAIATSN